jgi:hypothetical protein
VRSEQEPQPRKLSCRISTWLEELTTRQAAGCKRRASYSVTKDFVKKKFTFTTQFLKRAAHFETLIAHEQARAGNVARLPCKMLRPKPLTSRGRAIGFRFRFAFPKFSSIPAFEDVINQDPISIAARSPGISHSRSLGIRWDIPAIASLTPFRSHRGC